MKAKSYLWSHLPTRYGLDGKSASTFSFNLVFSSVLELCCHLQTTSHMFITMLQNIIPNLMPKCSAQVTLFTVDTRYNMGDFKGRFSFTGFFFFSIWTFSCFVVHRAKDIDAVILPQSKKAFDNVLFRAQESESITEGGKEGEEWDNGLVASHLYCILIL